MVAVHDRDNKTYKDNNEHKKRASAERVPEWSSVDKWLFD